MPCFGSWQLEDHPVPLGLLVVGCLLSALVNCENSLVLDFVDDIDVAALIMPCVGSWQ